MRHRITIFDLLENPQLLDEGVRIGEEVELAHPLITLDQILGTGDEDEMI